MVILVLLNRKETSYFDVELIERGITINSYPIEIEKNDPKSKSFSRNLCEFIRIMNQRFDEWFVEVLMYLCIYVQANQIRSNEKLKYDVKDNTLYTNYGGIYIESSIPPGKGTLDDWYQLFKMLINIDSDCT